MEIQIKQLSLSFDGQKIFEKLNFHFKEGFFYLLKGDSGCGKSSLLRMLVSLVKAEQGEITFSEALEMTELRRKVQLLPQMPVIFPGSVLENILVPYTISPYQDEKPSADRIDQLLKDLFPEGVKKEQDASTLSQGQKQRLAMIRVLLLNPQILLCDEPTSALDSKSRQIVDDCINDFFTKDPSRIIIYISHHDQSFISTDKRVNLTMTQQGINSIK
jgi:putative ABC transport system ATP-binding protein